MLLVCKCTSRTLSVESCHSHGSLRTRWQRHRTCGKFTEIDFFFSLTKTSQGSLTVSILQASWVSNKSEERPVVSQTELLKSKSNKQQNEALWHQSLPQTLKPTVPLRLHIVATALFFCVCILMRTPIETLDDKMYTGDKVLEVLET